MNALSPVIPRVLTVAGSDSSGGAGIQADLKTFTVFGVYGSSVITALTAQDTLRVSAIFHISAAFVRAQIDAVLGDIGTDAVKTGMLGTAAVIEEVAGAMREYRIDRLVVDPVMAAQSGKPLLEPDAVEVLRRELIPLATLVTPNAHEATALTGVEIVDAGGLRAAARELIRQGARAVLVKGGHVSGDESVDIFDDGRVVQELRAPRIDTPHTHGTGCQLSAAIAAGLASGKPVTEAVAIAKRFVTTAIENGLTIGRGSGPANPLAWLDRES